MPTQVTSVNKDTTARQFSVCGIRFLHYAGDRKHELQTRKLRGSCRCKRVFIRAVASRVGRSPFVTNCHVWHAYKRSVIGLGRRA